MNLYQKFKQDLNRPKRSILPSMSGGIEFISKADLKQKMREMSPEFRAVDDQIAAINERQKNGGNVRGLSAANTLRGRLYKTLYQKLGSPTVR